MSVGILRPLLRIRRGFWFGFLLAMGGLLSACGGGGGSGGGGGGGGGDAYSISTNSITFTATQGGAAPAPQTVAVSVNSGVVFIGTSQSGGNFSHVFTITGAITGAITITPDGPVNAGTFTGTITVRGCSTSTCVGGDVAGSPKTINVTYVVVPTPTLSSSPASVDFVTATGSTPPAKTLNLSLSTGSSSWTSSVLYTGGTPGWLGVTPALAGTLPATITLSVASVPPAGVHSATVTFSAGALTKMVPVTLTVKDPIVNFVSPYIATSSVPGDVIIRGIGFSSLVAPPLEVRFGGMAVTASVVSDTEIHAHNPGLAAGNYAVSVRDTSRTLPTRAQLVVVDALSTPPTTIVRVNNPYLVGNLIYDAERRALYLMDPDRNRIEGYRFNGTNAWTTDTPLIVGGGTGNPRIALSPDGTELLKTSGSNMWRINPATLSTIGSPADALPLLGAGGASLNLVAFANDGSAIGNAYAPVSGVTLYRYDMLTQQFAALGTQSDFTNRTIVASGNGGTLVLPSFESLIPAFAKSVFTYNSSDGSLTQRSVVTTRTEHASVDRAGSKFILTTAELSSDQVTTVYNSSFVAQGVLPDSAHDLRGFVISPDGTKAYAYYSGTGTIRKFDLPGVGAITEIGSGVPVDSPGSFFSAMTISPDGGTLFLAGTQRLIIVPAP